MKSSPSIWRYVVNVKLMVKIMSIFVASLENVNFNGWKIWVWSLSWKFPATHHSKDKHYGRPFQCEVCGKAFNEQFNLKKHFDGVHLGHKGQIFLEGHQILRNLHHT